MSEEKKEKMYAVQFYCTEAEYNAVKSAAEKTMRSISSFAKFNTVKIAQGVSEGLEGMDQE